MYQLLGGLEHDFCFSIYWESIYSEFPHPNRRRHILQRGRPTTNPNYVWYPPVSSNMAGSSTIDLSVAILAQEDLPCRQVPATEGLKAISVTILPHMAPKTYPIPTRATVGPKAKAKAAAPSRTAAMPASDTNPVVATIQQTLKWIASVPFGWSPAADRGLTPDQLLAVPIDAVNATYAIGMPAIGARTRLFTSESFSRANFGECAPKVARVAVSTSSVVLLWNFTQCLVSAETSNWADPEEVMLYSQTLPKCFAVPFP